MSLIRVHALVRAGQVAYGCVVDTATLAASPFEGETPFTDAFNGIAVVTDDETARRLPATVPSGELAAFLRELASALPVEDAARGALKVHFVSL